MKQVITVCDHADATCAGDVSGYRLWREGDRTAISADLCQAHAEPILTLMASGNTTELPSKPRTTMQVTKLRTTDATRHLKKE